MSDTYCDYYGYDWCERDCYNCPAYNPDPKVNSNNSEINKINTEVNTLDWNYVEKYR